jgi:hypothetical protein
MVTAVKPGGIVLDLQVIRPSPVIEANGRVLGQIDGEPLFRMADAAAAAIDASIRNELLVEEATDDHDVRKHYASGAELIADFEDKLRKLPEESLPKLGASAGPCAVRERCRLGRLRVR